MSMSLLKTTLHATDRQRQRNIHPRVVELVLDEGVPLSRNPDRLLFGRRQLRALREEGRVDRELLDRAEKAVPLVCVVSNGTLVTIFRPRRSINRGR